MKTTLVALMFLLGFKPARAASDTVELTLKKSIKVGEIYWKSPKNIYYGAIARTLAKNDGGPISPIVYLSIDGGPWGYCHEDFTLSRISVVVDTHETRFERKKPVTVIVLPTPKKLSEFLAEDENRLEEKDWVLKALESVGRKPEGAEEFSIILVGVHSAVTPTLRVDVLGKHVLKPIASYLDSDGETCKLVKASEFEFSDMKIAAARVSCSSKSGLRERSVACENLHYAREQFFDKKAGSFFRECLDKANSTVAEFKVDVKARYYKENSRIHLAREVQTPWLVSREQKLCVLDGLTSDKPDLRGCLITDKETCSTPDLIKKCWESTRDRDDANVELGAPGRWGWGDRLSTLLYDLNNKGQIEALATLEK